MKVWVYRNLLLAMIGWWPLMIYEIPLSWVESVEAYLNGYLCKWMGVSKNVYLYCDETPFSLPAHSLVTELKKRKVGGLYNSNSQKISQLETTSPNCLQVESGKLQSK